MATKKVNRLTQDLDKEQKNHTEHRRVNSTLMNHLIHSQTGVQQPLSDSTVNQSALHLSREYTHTHRLDTQVTHGHDDSSTHTHTHVYEYFTSMRSMRAAAPFLHSPHVSSFTFFIVCFT